MTLAELFRLPTRLTWALALIVLLAIVLILIGRCGRGDEITGARAGQTMAEGRTAAARDASAIRDRSDARQAETDAIVKEGSDEIRNAPDRASADAAARRRVCILTGCADAACAVLQPHPCRVD